MSEVRLKMAATVREIKAIIACLAAAEGAWPKNAAFNASET